MSQANETFVGRRNMASLGKQAQQGAAPELVAVKQQPFNAEAPLLALKEDITPTPLFYVRSNFATPEVNAADWNLTIDGSAQNPLTISLPELKSLPSREITTTMECAGNDRAGFSPAAEGELWSFGAVSTGRWRGVELWRVLESAGLLGSAVEIYFEGADGGKREGVPQPIPFARSLPLAKALHPDTILVYEMNGEPLPLEHGGPLRLIVSGWYGMASVKWLKRISALDQPFSGHFQADRYILQYPGQEGKTPIRDMQVKSLITNPTAGATLKSGPQMIEGLAWSGSANITSVEVNIDNSDSWRPATLLGEAKPYTWRRWQFSWEPTTPGTHTVSARATDAQNNSQPELSAWNRLGYVNNAIQHIEVKVTSDE